MGRDDLDRLAYRLVLHGRFTLQLHADDEEKVFGMYNIQVIITCMCRGRFKLESRRHRDGHERNDFLRVLVID